MFCTGFIQQFSNSMAPAYLYYTGVPISIISLVLGFIILRFGDKNKSSKILFSLTIAFFFLFVSNIILWIAVDANMQTFIWFLNQFDFLFLPLLSFFLFSEFTKKNEISSSNFLEILILVLAAIFIPILLLGYNINYFDLYNCTVVETGLIVIYQNTVLILSCLIMAYLAIKNIFSATETRESKTKTILLAVGLCSMLFSLFFTWNPLIFGYPDGVDQFGFIGAIIFLSIITYMVVKFKVFGIKLLATQALVWGLVALIGSQFFFIQVTTNFILNGIGFLAAIILGQYLIRSVKKEIQQKEELAKLNIDLEASIKQRESLVHLVTHKVKGSFTRSKYIFAGMLDGTFGEVTPELKKYAEQGLESDNMGIETVDLVLNVDNLQKGIVKYNMQKVDFREIVEKTIEEKRGPIESKGLKVETSIKDGVYGVLGDSFWLKEVVNNLIENSFKYTKEGTITVCLEDGNSKVKLYVKDTGVGITEDDKKNLFTEGGRGKESVKVNVDSTGYGLYSIKLVVEAHKGRVWAESEGAGKGSTFYVELDSVS